MAWEENSHICLHMQLIAILSRIEVDDDVYHIGASIKDLGKKWFGFSKMEILAPDELVERINRG